MAISIPIVSGASYSYVNTDMVEIWKLVTSKFPNNIMVCLPTEMRMNITLMAKGCCFKMNG